jgi:hypothetical protein
MVATGEPGNEKGDRAVADELVDDPIGVVYDLRRRPVEAGDQARVLLRQRGCTICRAAG